MKYKFRIAVEPDEDEKNFDVSLRDDAESGDVDVLINGKQVAFFSHVDGNLYLNTGLDESLGLPLTKAGEIQTV